MGGGGKGCRDVSGVVRGRKGVGGEVRVAEVWVVLVAFKTVSLFSISRGCADWLNTNGDSGRVLVSDPALWTENEGGFQVWRNKLGLGNVYFFFSILLERKSFSSGLGRISN